MIDILNLRNEMEDYLLLMNKHILETETNIDLINVLSTAQYHIDRISMIFNLGESWLKGGPHSALISIKGETFETGLRRENFNDFKADFVCRDENIHFFIFDNGFLSFGGKNGNLINFITVTHKYMYFFP